MEHEFEKEAELKTKLEVSNSKELAKSRQIELAVETLK